MIVGTVPPPSVRKNDVVSSPGVDDEAAIDVPDTIDGNGVKKNGDVEA